MQTYMRQYADTALLDGWLQLMSGTSAESSTSYRVPGTAYKYRWHIMQLRCLWFIHSMMNNHHRCKSGWELTDYTNPDQVLR